MDDHIYGKNSLFLKKAFNIYSDDSQGIDQQQIINLLIQANSPYLICKPHLNSSENEGMPGSKQEFSGK